MASAVPSVQKISSLKKDILYYIRSSSQSKTADNGLKNTVRTSDRPSSVANSRFK